MDGGCVKSLLILMIVMNLFESLKFCSWVHKDTRHFISWEFRFCKAKQIHCMASCCWDVNKCWAACRTGMITWFAKCPWHLTLLVLFVNWCSTLVIDSVILIWLFETLFTCFSTLNMKTWKIFCCNRFFIWIPLAIRI